MYSCVLVPGLGRDLTGNVTSAARSLKTASSVLPYNASDDGEREADKHPGAQQQEHRGGWQSLGGATEPVD